MWTSKVLTAALCAFVGGSRATNPHEMYAADGHCLATPGTPSTWGHIYLSGGVEGLEFFTSMFSTEFSCEPLELVIAEPETACDVLELPESVKGKAVLVKRGDCSFGRKAETLGRAGAQAMILDNAVDNTLFSMPDNDMDASTDTHYNRIPSVMVRHRTALLLRHHLRGQPGARVLLRGEYSKDDLGFNVFECGKCQGDANEQEIQAKRFHGGRLHVSPHKEKLEAWTADAERLTVDFFVGYVGASVPADRATPLVLPQEGNEDGCDPFEEQNMPVGGLVVVKRGTCVFSQKMENAYNAGAHGVVVVNSGSEIALPGIEDKDLDPFSINFKEASLVSSPILFQHGGELLVKKMRETKGNLYARFEPTNLTLSDTKELKIDINELQYWQASTLEHFVPQTYLESFIKELNLNEERAASVRAMFVSSV